MLLRYKEGRSILLMCVGEGEKERPSVGESGGREVGRKGNPMDGRQIGRV